MAIPSNSQNLSNKAPNRSKAPNCSSGGLITYNVRDSATAQMEQAGRSAAGMVCITHAARFNR